MNKYLKTAILLLFFSQIDAQPNAHQQHELLNPSKRWILINNKIDKNEIIFQVYKTSKLRANTFVLRFVSGGKIEYDYETNFAFKSDARIQFLDLVTDESSWEYDSLSKQLSLTIKGGYSSLEDFKFKRSYSIEHLQDSYILRQVGEVFYEDLKQKARLEKLQLAQIKKNEAIAQKKRITPKKYNSVKVISKTDSIEHKVANVEVKPQVLPNNPEPVEAKNSQQSIINSQQTKIIEQELLETKTVETKAPPTVAVDYVALSKDLLDKTKRWMLVKNKIERNDIFLTTYNESKLTINNLIMSFDTVGKITYDYESDPKIKFCAGVDFLDIDIDETSWEYSAEKNIVTLILKGGYASLDDFKFKREYWVEAIEDGYILRKQKEHYFTDFRKPVKKEKKLSH